MAPPSSPTEPGTGGDWGKVTSTFGKPLPTDYMTFVDRYGSGEIGKWLTIFNPFSKNPNVNLLESFTSLLASIAALKE